MTDTEGQIQAISETTWTRDPLQTVDVFNQMHTHLAHIGKKLDEMEPVFKAEYGRLFENLQQCEERARKECRLCLRQLETQIAMRLLTFAASHETLNITDRESWEMALRERKLDIDLPIPALNYWYVKYVFKKRVCMRVCARRSDDGGARVTLHTRLSKCEDVQLDGKDALLSDTLRWMLERDALNYRL